ncbi:MAG: hypothetical protein U0103_15930 [Candidatus Obscuribacterales bacterium]
MGTADNNDRSLMSTILANSKSYRAQGRVQSAECVCNNSSSLADVFFGKPKGESLIAYIRAPNQEEINRRWQEIDQHSKSHSYKIVQLFTDTGDRPSFGLQSALEALEYVDGLISCEMQMFIKDNGDRIRELRPFIHHFFCLHGKHLITIFDGIDTSTYFGQENAIELMCQTKAGFET